MQLIPALKALIAAEAGCAAVVWGAFVGVDLARGSSPIVPASPVAPAPAAQSVTGAASGPSLPQPLPAVVSKPKPPPTTVPETTVPRATTTTTVPSPPTTGATPETTAPSPSTTTPTTVPTSTTTAGPASNPDPASQ